MFNRLKRFVSGSVAAEPEEVAPAPKLPAGFFAPVTTDELLSPKNRWHSLKQIRDNNMMPKSVYEEMCHTPLCRLLLSSQNVPAARNGRWSRAGGFGDLTLLYTSYAVRLARGKMFPPGATSEEQAAQADVWQAVIFWSALFYHLPLLAHLEGELSGGKGWQPGISVPDEAFRFRFRRVVPQGSESQQLAAVMAGRFLPEGAAAWLATVPAALQNLAGSLWNQHPEMALIRDVLREAAKQTESPLLPGGIIAPVSNLCSADIVPGDVTALCKTETALISAASGGELAAEEKGVSDSGEDVSAEEQIQPLAQEKPSGKTTEQNEDDEENPDKTEKILTNTDTAMLLSILSPEETQRSAAGEVSSDGNGENKEISEEELNEISDIHGASQPGEDSPYKVCEAQQEYMSGDTVAEEDNPDLTGEKFLEWLKEGLKSGALSFNRAGDKIHVVAGFIFLPVPGIFFDYLKAVRLSGEKREALQYSFEQLDIHKRRDAQRFYHVRIDEMPGSQRRYKTRKGYLIKGHGLVNTNKLKDSQYISIY